MIKSKTILATIALGAVLAVGSGTASMARGGGGGGHVGGGHFGGGGHFDGPHLGGHGFGGGIPPIMHGRGYNGSYGGHFRHGYGGYGPGYGLLFAPNLYDDDGYDTSYSAGYCARIHPSYDPKTGTYFGRDGRMHYCP